MITEANGEFLVFFQHDCPDDINIVYGANKQQIKKLDDFDFISASVPWKGNLMVVENDDESLHIIDTRCKNINQLKSKLLKEISDCLEKADDDWVEMDLDTIGQYLEFGDNVNDYILKGKGVKEIKPEVYYNAFVEFFNDSCVDCDSSSQKLLIDPTRAEVLWGPKNAIIMDNEEFLSRLEELSEEQN